jgi:hypothetical protein
MSRNVKPAAAHTVALRDGDPDGVASIEAVDPEAPLRLAVAAKLAFPRGGMTVSGLRREIAKGRLAVEVIAGKQFTTLENIRRMRESCRVTARVPISGNEKRDGKTGGSSAPQFGSSRIMASTSPQAALEARLKRDRQRKPKER